ncbi:hypothetical protein D3C79_942800 [compost metagenome]
MAQGEDRATGGQGNVSGMGRQIGQVGERVEYLAGVTESRVVQGHIAYPHGCEAQAVDFVDQLRLPTKHSHVTVMEAKRQEDAQCQLAMGEHATVTGMLGEGIGARAFAVDGVQGQSLHAVHLKKTDSGLCGSTLC